MDQQRPLLQQQDLDITQNVSLKSNPSPSEETIQKLMRSDVFLNLLFPVRRGALTGAALTQMV